MENCEYQAAPSAESDLASKRFTHWKHFLRQFLVCSGVWTSIFLYGLGVGAPTVYIPQIRREANSTNVITDDMASWLSSVYGFSGFPFVIILSIVTTFAGRKVPFIIAIANSFAASIVMYYSRNVTHVLISSIMQGFFTAAQLVIAIMILTEYTSPKYRGVFLTIKSATFYWGIWASNAIGTFSHWKMIPLFALMCAAYTSLTIFVWPESPYWLASRGKFKECAESHRWLKGCNEESERELESLIDTQNQYIAMHGNVQMTIIERIIDLFKTLKSREFYKPTLLAIIIGLPTVLSGKLICSVYALDIIKKITNSESTAYTAMLILDGVTVLSMYVGCVLTKFIKRRPLLLGASTIGILFLLQLSLYLYLIKLSVIVENKYVSILLLVLVSLFISSGPLILSASVFGELIPLRSRNLSICVISLFAKLSTAVMLKIAPSLFKTFDVHGMFLFFGISSLIVLIVVYKYLPETKDKTLQEITDSIKAI